MNVNDNDLRRHAKRFSMALDSSAMEKDRCRDDSTRSARACGAGAEMSGISISGWRARNSGIS